jgi:hypothetical protein
MDMSMEIVARLEAEWRRPPTVLEVAAVHQMVVAKHNQRQIDGRLVLGAVFLIGYHDR